MEACPVTALAVVLENRVATRLRLVSRLVVHTLGAVLLRSLRAANEFLALRHLDFRPELNSRAVPRSVFMKMER